MVYLSGVIDDQINAAELLSVANIQQVSVLVNLFCVSDERLFVAEVRRDNPGKTFPKVFDIGGEAREGVNGVFGDEVVCGNH